MNTIDYYTRLTMVTHLFEKRDEIMQLTTWNNFKKTVQAMFPEGNDASQLVLSMIFIRHIFTKQNNHYNQEALNNKVKTFGTFMLRLIEEGVMELDAIIIEKAFYAVPSINLPVTDVFRSPEGAATKHLDKYGAKEVNSVTAQTYRLCILKP